ncbi:anti-sigma factor [Nakamurella flavida]|uniref:Regulator of SigK n=1 Tax=Nakamurella flavida TaxID=363630 RepID=A0A938YQK3_9ACTN|nr:anti-sigma factor [Nakamurella flavida]MBM9477574.1 anti-sigma factor [Nakamurella flavida]MDP9779122.1 hypothetical protein [Nakamurella flavida]
MTMNNDLYLLTGAMALDALPEDETADFREYAEQDPAVAAEYQSFLATVALLGSVAAESPPAGLRDKVMAQIAVTPQLPPLTSHQPIVTSTAPVAPTPPAPAAGTDDDGHLAPVVPLRPWFRRPATWIAAAAAAIVIGTGTTIIVEQSSSPTDPLVAVSDCVLSDQGRQVITPQVGAGAQVILSRACNGAVLDVTSFEQLPAGSQYQLWALEGDAAPKSLGLLVDASKGEAQQQVASLAGGETGIAVSVEPTGGSVAPTQDKIVFVAPISA